MLGEWRAAERRLAELSPESEDGRRVTAEIELLRHQYHELFKRSAGRTKP